MLFTALTCVAEPARVLRVAADPNNLPFSNQRLEGFENRLAELVARELGAELEYMWWPQRRGFIRETVGSGRADLVMGVPADYELVATTRPYYHSSYVFVRKPGVAPVHSFDDPELRKLRVGVQLTGDDFYNTPPAHALSRRGIIQNVRGYTVYGNYAEESPPSAIIRAVATGEVDIAIAWGPLAGYYAQRQSVPLLVEPVTVTDADAMLPFVFGISVGARRGNKALLQEVQAVLDQRADEVAQILDAYNVPRVARTSEGREPRMNTDGDEDEGQTGASRTRPVNVAFRPHPESAHHSLSDPF